MNAGAAERVNAHADVRTPDRIHIEHIAKIAYVRIEKVMPVRGGGAPGPFERNSLHALEGAFQKRIGPGFDPSGNLIIRRPAVGRVVLEAAIVWRIVRRRDDNAVRQPALAAAVISEYCVGNHRGGRVFVLIREHDLDAVGRQHLERAGTRRHR